MMGPSYKFCIFLISIVLLCLRFQCSNSENSGEVYVNGTDHKKSAGLKPEEVIEDDTVTETWSRTKRNHLSNSLHGTSSVPGTSVEGLLASCQLTNLLLYQLLQQRANTGGHFPGGNIIQPFAAAGGIINNILAPPRLTTYLSTSTFLTKMTSTAIITIPLLFGNKPSPTTITRTKIYEVTTSEVHTITTTVEPSSTTVTQTQTATIIAPAPAETSQVFLLNTATASILDRSDEEFDNEQFQIQRPNPQHTVTPVLKLNSQVEEINSEKSTYRKRKKNRVPNLASPVSHSPPGRERRILKANPATTENYIEPHYPAERTPAYKYGSESYGKKRYDQSPSEPYFNEPIRSQPQIYQQYNDEEGLNQNYYTRRLKRRGEAVGDDENLSFEREYLLEPSFDGDESNSFQQTAQCPPPIEITITKTITKFVNPPASISHPNAPVRPATREKHGPSNFERSRGRRIEVPRHASPTEQPIRTQDSPRNAQFEIPKPSYNERRSRGEKRYEAYKPSQDKLNSSLENKKDEENPQPASKPRARTRGRGDILHRAIASTGPSPEYIKFQEEAGGFGEVEPGRVRHRIRSPSPTASK